MSGFKVEFKKQPDDEVLKLVEDGFAKAWSDDLTKIGWTDESRAAAAQARWKHFDNNGASLQEGDRVYDPSAPKGKEGGRITRTLFEGGNQSKPLVEYKNDMGVTATRDPRDLIAARTLDPEHQEYNRDLALRVRDKQVGSGMKHRG